MMKKRGIIMAAGLMLLAAFSSFGQTKDDDTIVLGKEIMPKDSTKQRRFKNHIIAPKGEWQCGLSVMYADFSSDDSEYMLLFQGIDAGASMLRLAPEAAYAFADNHAAGARFQYTNLNGSVDAATADLLGNLNMSIENVHALSRSMSGCVYQRTYVGLDNRGRVGIFWDYILGLSRTKSQFYTGDTPNSYSVSKKIHLGFAPGIVYFPMNNVSVQACLSLADLSYSSVTAYEGGQPVGKRNVWKAQASLNILDISVGLTIHL